MEGNLKENGWFLSTEGIAECEKACSKEKPTTTDLAKAAANLDLRQFGLQQIPDELSKGKLTSIKGPIVLQIQKLRNISAPKANEESNHAPRLLKLQLTDGRINCQGLEAATIPDLSLSTPPGTKICLVGSVPVQNSVLMLDSTNLKVLGGEVEKLVTKWKLQKTLAKHSRTIPSGEEGPPPFVPFRQLQGDSRGRPGDRHKVNSGISNGYEKHSNHENSEGRIRNDNRGNRASQDSGNRRDRGQPYHSREDRNDYRGDNYRGNNRSDNRDTRVNYNRNDSKDTRNDSRMATQEKSYGRPQYDGRPNNRDSNDRWKQGQDERGQEAGRRDQGGEDRGTYRKPDQGRADRTERGPPYVSSRGGGRGGTRGGRGGRRDSAGRGQSDSTEQDEQDEYRARQPSDCGTLWDYLESKLPVKSTSKPLSPSPTATTTTTTTATTQQTLKGESQSPEPDSESNSSPTLPRQGSSDSEPPPQPAKQESNRRTKQEGTPSPPREQQKGRDSEWGRGDRGDSRESTIPHRGQQGPRQYQQRQQNPGQGRNRGQRGRHEDGRMHNQSLPPRMQKKQQQYQQHYYNRDSSSSTDKEVQRDKNSSPSSGSGGEGRSSQSPSTPSVESPKSNDSPQPAGQQKYQGRKGYQRHPQDSQSPSSGQKPAEPQPVQTYVPPQQGLPQPVYQIDQTRHYEMQAIREQPDMNTMVQHGYHYQHATPPVPAPQQYPVYQLQHQMTAPPSAGMAPSQQAMSASQHTQMAPIRWKKGDQCLALRRDGQFYSAKIEDITPDGTQCMVSFPDFQGVCEMVMVTSLRPFPIIAWTDAGNVPHSMPATTITAVPVYAQPTPVAMVPRPQVMVPVQAQPHFSMAPRVAAQPPHPPPGVQWQPAPMSYPADMRAQAYQPMVHYDPMPQTSNPAARPAFYAVPPGGPVQFVRGVKELHGQELYDGSDGNKPVPASTVYYSKPKKMGPQRPTQNFYVPPRQHKYKEQNN